tara:strand:- start:2011 stop:2445 length:435 start_codon:yes stop_codon:yes gene_type:complete
MVDSEEIRSPLHQHDKNYIFLYKEINDKIKEDSKWSVRLYKNALREVNQKRIKDYNPIKKFKKSCKIENGNSICPVCGTECKQLTCAHIGVTQSDIIDEILVQNLDDTKNLVLLDRIDREKHNDVKIAVCCSKCNKEMETFDKI